MHFQLTVFSISDGSVGTYNPIVGQGSSVLYTDNLKILFMYIEMKAKFKFLDGNYKKKHCIMND